MTSNYIINDVKLLDKNTNGIHPLYIQTKVGDNLYDTIIEISNDGISNITSDWDYLQKKEDASEEEMDILRWRLVDLINRANETLLQIKEYLMRKENKNGEEEKQTD